MLDAVGLDQAGADDSDDPFAAINQDLEPHSLIEQTGSDSRTPEEFVSGDDDLPVCVEMDNENWNETFLEELTATDGHEDTSQEMDEDQELDDDGPVLPKLKTYKGAINSLEDVYLFLEHKGHGIEALSVGTSIDQLAL